MVIAPALRIDPRFERRRRGRQNHGCALDPSAHHGHVPRMIMRPVILLVGAFMLFVDDDQTKFCIGQKQRRARPRHHLRIARGDGRENPFPFPPRNPRMPFCRLGPEARGEPVQKLRGQRDFRHEDQRLLALPECRRNRLEIHFRLARTRHAFEKCHGKRAFGHSFCQLCCSILLVGLKRRHCKIGVRLFHNRFDRHKLRRQRSLVDQPVDHGGAHARLVRQRPFAEQQAAFRRRNRPSAGRRQSLRQGARQPHADLRRLFMLLVRPAQCHAQHCTPRCQRIACHPIDELHQRHCEPRHCRQFLHLFQIGIAARPVPDLPNHAHRFSCTERNAHDIPVHQAEV